MSSISVYYLCHSRSASLALYFTNLFVKQCEINPFIIIYVLTKHNISFNRMNVLYNTVKTSVVLYRGISVLAIQFSHLIFRWQQSWYFSKKKFLICSNYLYRNSYRRRPNPLFSVKAQRDKANSSYLFLERGPHILL